MNKKAVIFDMDGVLIDSEPLWQRAQVKVLKEFGHSITAEDCVKYTMGRRIDSVCKIWIKLFKLDTTVKELQEGILTELFYLIDTEGEAMPGVLDLLNHLKSNNYKIAIATSSSYRLIDKVTKKLKIEEYFSVLCSADDEEHGKPHPAVYLTAVEKLGLTPDKCIILEDSLNGLIAAKAASVTSFLIGLHCDMPKFAFADRQLKTLNDVIPYV